MKKILFITIFGFVFSLSSVVFAAGGFFFQYPSNIKINDEFSINVSFDTGSDTINAVSGTLTVDSDLELLSVLNNNILIPLWLESPTISEDKKTVSFAGVIPGGYKGAREIFTIVARAKNSGAKNISVSKSEALLNDGKASAIEVTLINQKIQISKEIGNSKVEISDNIIPEDFMISLIKNSDQSEQKTLAIFNTSDKQSGLNHYEAVYAFLRAPKDGWKVAESPFEINSYGKKLFIKAIDNAGNYRIQSIATPGYYVRLIIIGIILILILWVLYYFRKKFL